MLRRDTGDRTEFITPRCGRHGRHPGVRGDDIEAPVLYPEDERFLVDGLSTVTHYEVADQI